MSYTSIVQMAGSSSLAERIAAAAADEGQQDPLTWARANIWVVVSADQSWADAWAYAIDSYTLDNNPDTGARPGVINDSMILAVVQPMVLGTPEA